MYGMGLWAAATASSDDVDRLILLFVELISIVFVARE